MLSLFAQQKAIALFEKINPGTTVYNNTAALELKDDIDEAALVHALKDLQKRHTLLRCRLIQTDEDFFFEETETDSELPFESFVVEGLPPREALQESKQLLQAHDLRNINLDQGPLWRCAVVKDKFTSRKLFLINYQEMLLDANSLQLFISELGELYQAHIEHRSAQLSTLKNDNLDSKLSEQLQSERLKYWQNKLSNSWPLDFNQAYKKNKPMDYSGDRVYFELPQNILKQTAELTKDSSLTSILFAALFVTVSNYTHENDLCLGLQTTERKENDNRLNSYNNSLPVRIQINEDDSFQDLIKQLKQTIQEGLNHKLPINTITQNALNISRKTLSKVAAPFDVMCCYNKHNSTSNTNSLFIDQPIHLNLKHSRFENFGFCFNEYNGAISGYVEFNKEHFNKETIQDFSRRYLKVLASLLANPEQKIKKTSILLDKEKQLYTEFLKSNERLTPSDQSIQQIFNDVAKQNLEKTAIVFHDAEHQSHSITYRELDQLTTKLAAYLQHIGVDANKLVGVSITRSINLIIAIMSILKAGGTVVPLESANESDGLPRIKYRINDACLDMVLVDDTTEALFHEHEKPLHVINIEGQDYLKYTRYLNLLYNATIPSPEQLAYIMYTSGTTGEPKGVMIEHGSLTNLAYAVKDRNLPAGGNVLCNAPATFDCFFWELLEWLATNGGELHLINEEERLSPAIQEEVIRKHNIACATLLPPLLDNLTPEHLPSLRDIISMGAVAHEATLKKWHDQGRTIRNEYGPTEATICSTDNPYNPNVSFTSIGVPIRNAKVLILDQNLSLCPIGVAGKIYIGGKGLAQGYIGKPELTKKSFIWLNYDTEQSCYRKIKEEDKLLYPNAVRYYDTGDVANFILDPEKKLKINFLGRHDRQLKINGVRIELDGIEAIFRKYSQIQDVLLVPTRNADALIAYIITKENVKLDQAKLHDFLKTTTIPHVARPKACILLEKFPLTKNGKIDVKKLPEPVIINSAEVSPPVTPLQQHLCRIWTKILRTEVNTINKTFAELGGTSIALASLEAILLKELRLSNDFRISALYKEEHKNERKNKQNKDPKEMTIQILEKKLQPYVDAKKHLGLPNRGTKDLLPIFPFGRRKAHRPVENNETTSPRTNRTP